MQDILAGLFVIGLLVVIAAIYFVPAAWAVGDAQKRGQSGIAMIVLFWLFGPFSALIWLAMRSKQTMTQREPATYDNPDDALDSAARLDQLGEWDAAIALYQDASSRWPEHRDYVEACIESIRGKQSLNTK